MLPAQRSEHVSKLVDAEWDDWVQYIRPDFQHSLQTLQYRRRDYDVRPTTYEWPCILTGTYNSSRYFSSSSLNSLPLTSNASSIRATLLNPTIGLATRLQIHASATVPIFQLCFLASSSTRPMIFLSTSLLPENVVPFFCSPSDREVLPNADTGRARCPLQSGLVHTKLAFASYTVVHLE